MLTPTRITSDRVSVVIPVRNRRTSVGRAVASALGQTHSVEEIIVVDDGSTDGTWELVERLAKSDRRIIPVRNRRRPGAQAARNTGICVAKGAWIAFLDSDDFWFPHSVEVRLKAACDLKTPVVHSDGAVTRRVGDVAQFGLRSLQGAVLDALLRAPGPMFPGMLVRRDVLHAIGLLDEEIVAFQEWDTAIRLAGNAAFAFVREATFMYDCTGSDTISSDGRRDVAGYAQVVTKHASLIEETVGGNALEAHYLLMAERFSRARDWAGLLWTLRRLGDCETATPWSCSRAAAAAAKPWLPAHIRRAAERTWTLLA